MNNTLFDETDTEIEEKAILNGFETLSDIELFSLILNVRHNNLSSIDVARKIFMKYSELFYMFDLSYDDLIKEEGIGKRKALAFKSLLTLLKRYFNYYLWCESKTYREINFYAKELIKLIGTKNVEFFAVICLNSNKNIISIDKIAMGEATRVAISHKDVFKNAIIKGANSIIIAHNHPSGNVKPSEEDVFLTQKIIESGGILGIPVLDHIIVSEENFFSFKDNLIVY